VSLSLEELRWRRTQRIRWDDTRRETYAQFLAEVHSAFSWWIMSESGIKVLANLAEFRQLRDRVVSSIAPLNIIAGEKVKLAADDLVTAVIEATEEGASRLAERGLLTKTPVSPSERDRLTDLYLQKRTMFERSVRDELGIS